METKVIEETEEKVIEVLTLEDIEEYWRRAWRYVAKIYVCLMATLTWIWLSWCVWIAFLFHNGVLVWDFNFVGELILELFLVPITAIILIITSIYIMKEEKKRSRLSF